MHQGSNTPRTCFPKGFATEASNCTNSTRGRRWSLTSRLLPDHSSREELSWIDASGKVLRQAEVTLDEGNWHRGMLRHGSGTRPFRFRSSLAVVAAVVVPLQDLGEGLAPNYATALARTLTLFWPALLVVTLLSAALAWHCCRTQSPLLSAIQRLMVRVRPAPGPSRSGGLSLPPPLAGPGEVSGVRAFRSARPGNLRQVRRGISAAGPQGLRSVRVRRQQTSPPTPRLMVRD